MTGLESTLAAAEVGMLGSLDYRLPQVSSFVTERKEVTFYPLGGNSYAPTGVRVLIFQCSGLGFLDASSVTLSLQVNNLDGAKVLKPLTPELACMIQEIRVLLGGTVVETISGYNRLYKMLSQGLSVAQNRNNADMAFGLSSDDAETGQAWVPATVPASGNVQVLHKVMSGLTQQRLFIPLWALQAGGLTVEIMTTGTAGEALDSTVTYSQDWSWSNCQLKADVLRVDDEMMQSYSKFILSGKHLLIPLKTYSVVNMSVAGPDWELAVPRQFARLNGCWITFRRIGSETETLKEGNHFYFPYASQNSAEATIQVGSQKFPDHTYKSLSEFIYRYYKACGLDKSSSHTATVKRQSFASTHWITAFDLETVPQANHSGLNTSAGSIVVSFKNVGTAVGDYCSSAVVTLMYDCIAEIGDSGVTVAY
jgi:hypothetical protein